MKGSWKFVVSMLLGALCSVGIYFLPNAAGSSTIATVLEDVTPGEWVETDQRYNAVSVEFLDGQEHAKLRIPGEEEILQLYADPDDSHGTFSSFLLIPYTKNFYFESEGNLNVHLFNSERETRASFFAGTKYVEGLRIISREEWGANETIRYDFREDAPDYSGQSLSATESACQTNIDRYPDEYVYDKVISQENGHQLLWPRQYSKKIQKIVVHHTAESDKSRTIPGADKIRSIYYFHAVTRGWGDIGYHFIIDQDGNIYEGRAGGDYVVAAHSYCSNINTLGVALMGDFNRNNPTKKQVASLTKLLNALEKKYDIDLSKESKFHGEKTPNLLGHRNLKATACPGDNLYSLLPSFRRYLSTSGVDFSVSETNAKQEDYGAELVGSPKVIDMEAATTQTFTLTYRNTGRVTWDQSSWIYVSNNENKNLWADSIVLEKNYVAAQLRESRVSPGGIGHFDITLNSGVNGGTHSLEMTPIINSQRKMNSASVLVAAKIPETRLAYEFISAKHAENPFYYGQYKEATIVLKNTGNIDWKRSGPFAVTLSPPNGKNSDFANERTPNTLAWMQEEVVRPGQKGTFVFDIHGNFRQGIFDLPFLPRMGEDIFFQDIGMKFIIQVKKPDYQAQILYENSALEFLPGETKTVRVGLRNQSNVDWQENQIALRAVRTSGMTLQDSIFFFPDYIPMNRTGFINLTIKAPLTKGKSVMKFQVLANGKKFNKTRWLDLPFTVKEAELEGDITYLSRDTIGTRIGVTEDVTLRVKNIGNTVWQQKGANAVRLVPLRFSSDLRGQKWVSKDIVAYMENESVPPGKVATFKFQIRRNTTGEINEYFALKTKSLGTVSNTRFNITGKATESSSSSTVKSSGSSSQSLLDKIRARREELNSRDDNSSSELESTTSSSKIDTSSTNVSRSGSSIRVLLSFPETAANVTAPTTHYVVVDGSKVADLTPQDALWTRKDGNEMLVSVANQKFRGDVVQIVPRKAGDYSRLYNWNRSPAWNKNLKDNTFEGTLEFRIDDGKMIVINDLDMEAYLRGMAEVPEAEPEEKRKAMAILARSYARHYTETEYKKFPGKSYDGSDSPDVFQKYLGHNYSLRSPKWQEALSTTRGETIYYNNEILRTAYFSCSDGMTKTPEEAGWTQDYFKKTWEVFQAVDDSHGADKIRYKRGTCGHGVGLSGLGAKALAEQGKTYKDILNYYYNAIEIRKD